MSAWSILTCGRPLPVSSIFTATTPFLVGLRPVNGFVVGGAEWWDGAGGSPAEPDGAAEVADPDREGGVDVTARSLALHADSASAAVTTATADRVVVRCVMDG